MGKNDIIKYIKKQNRIAFWRLKHVRLNVIFLIISCLLFVLSYCLKDSMSWISALFQSLGVGILTGVVLYVLGNIRNLTESKLDSDRTKLGEIKKIISRIYNSIPPKALFKYFKSSNYKVDLLEGFDETVRAAMEFIKAMRQLDFELYQQFLNENQVDIIILDEKLSDIIKDSSGIKEQDVWVYKDAIISLLEDSMSWFELEDKKVNTQYRQLKKYPL